MKISKLTPDNTILKELGERLGRIRKQQGYVQEALAKEAGIGVATLRRIEDGKDSQLSSWLKLLKALQMADSINALLPNDLTSPMTEVLGKSKYRASKASSSNIAEPTRVQWGDES